LVAAVVFWHARGGFHGCSWWSGTIIINVDEICLCSSDVVRECWVVKGQWESSALNFMGGGQNRAQRGL
jgi:hypothetical protein